MAQESVDEEGRKADKGQKPWFDGQALIKKNIKKIQGSRS